MFGRGSMCVSSAAAERAPLWLLLVLALSLLCGLCGGSEDIQVAVRNLGDALRTSMQQPVDYSEPQLDLGYQAATTFNPRGMGTLYNVTNLFIDLVVREQTFPDELVVAVNTSQVNIQFLQRNWKLLIHHYAGIFGIAVAGLLFAIILPLVGFIFCCCRCAGRCGAHTEPFEKRHDPCKRITLGILLSVITIIILFGVVCAFVTNQYLEEGVNSYHTKLQTGIQDAQLYLDNTDKEVQNSLVTNFEELRKSLLSTLSKAGNVVKGELSTLSNATILSNMTSFVTGLNSIQLDLGNISNYVNELQTRTADLNNTLSLVKNNLTENLKQCQSVPECADLVKQVKNLSAADFDSLPSVDNSLDSVTKLLEPGGGIVANIEKAIAHFDDLSHDIQANITKKTPEVNRTSIEAGEKIKEIANEISKVLKDAKVQVRSADSTISQGQMYIDKYARYRYYLCLGMSCILLLILFCLTMGLFYGFCGKRPDEYGSDCCTRATGARFLMAGVAFMFLFSILLMVLTLAHFLVGVTGHKVVCESLQFPQQSQVFSLINSRVNVNDLLKFTNSSSIDTNVSNIIATCQKNASLYEILQLSRVVDVSKIRNYPTTYNMTNSIADIKRLTFSLNNNDFEILDNSTKKKLHDLSKSFENINFEAFDKMQDAIVQIDLMNLAHDLNNTADILVGKSEPKIAASLRMQAAKLQRLQETEVVELAKVVKQLKARTLSLQNNIKFNHSSLGEAVDSLITSADAVELYMKKNGTESINMLIEEFLNSSVKLVETFLLRTIDNVTSAGRCGPLSQVYSSVIIATCNQVFDPFNGFWASIGWSVLLFIPAIILSVKLATLYKKSDPYPGPLVETDYLYDAYADRDNIPLANVHDKKGHHRRYDETYDNSTGYMGDYSAHLGRDRGRGDGRSERGAAAAGQNDGRYSDMAPKNWDYPNGNSPRYNSPPLSTEYERPPPYYYPGPGDTRR